MNSACLRSQSPKKYNQGKLVMSAVGKRGNSPCLCPSASWSRIRRLDDVTHIVRGETSLLYELTQILISLLENSCQTQLRMSFDQESHNPSCSSNWCIKCTNIQYKPRVVFLNYSSLSILVSHWTWSSSLQLSWLVYELHVSSFLLSLHWDYKCCHNTQLLGGC